MDFDFGHSFGLPFAKSPFARLIPTFAGSQYGTIDTAITFAGDFEMEVKVAIPDGATGSFQILTGQTTTADYFGVSGAGVLSLKIAGTVLSSAPVTVDPFDGKIHTWKATRIGSVGTLTIDGVVQVTGAVGAGNSTWETIGANILPGATNFLNGQILSVKFTDAGTVVANYVFDSGSDLYQFPKGENLGVSSVTGDNSNFENDLGDWYAGTTGVLTNPSNSMEVANTVAASGRGVLLQNLVAGKKYILSARISPGVNAPFGFLAVSGNFDGSGSHTFQSFSPDGSIRNLEFTASANTQYIVMQTSNSVIGDSIIINDVFVRQLPDSTCFLTNFATTDWTRYTKQINISHGAGSIAEAWVGKDLIINGRFNTNSDWTLSAGWAIAGGLATKTPGSTSSIIQDALSLGLPYLLTFDIPRIDVSFVRGYIGLGTLSPNYSTIGTKKFFGISTTNTNVYILADTLTEVDIDNVIANHILEVA